MSSVRHSRMPFFLKGSFGGLLRGIDGDQEKEDKEVKWGRGDEEWGDGGWWEGGWEA